MPGFKRRRLAYRRAKQYATAERHRFADILSATTVGASSGQANAIIYSAAEITTSASTQTTIPCKVTGFKIQFSQVSATAGINAYGSWALLYVPKGATVPTLATSGEIQNGDRNFVIDSGAIFFGGTATGNGYLYMYEPKVSRKMKGGDNIYLCVAYNHGAAGTSQYQYSIDFTILQ